MTGFHVQYAPKVIQRSGPMQVVYLWQRVRRWLWNHWKHSSPYRLYRIGSRVWVHVTAQDWQAGTVRSQYSPDKFMVQFDCGPGIALCPSHLLVLEKW